MAAFLHVAPRGLWFNGPDLGAWYAADVIATSAAEVAQHLRREAVATGLPEMARTYRGYSARLEDGHVDIRGQAASMADVYASDSHAASQPFGEAVRASEAAGILYDSVRRRGGLSVVTYRPTKILDVVQAEHYEIRVEAAARRIEVRRLAAPS
jgi:hypothetical protein